MENVQTIFSPSVDRTNRLFFPQLCQDSHNLFDTQPWHSNNLLYYFLHFVPEEITNFQHIIATFSIYHACQSVSSAIWSNSPPDGDQIRPSLYLRAQSMQPEAKIHGPRACVDAWEPSAGTVQVEESVARFEVKK